MILAGHHGHIRQQQQTTLIVCTHAADWHLLACANVHRVGYHMTPAVYGLVFIPEPTDAEEKLGGQRAHPQAVPGLGWLNAAS